jgi:hypothetical protein
MVITNKLHNSICTENHVFLLRRCGGIYFPVDCLDSSADALMSSADCRLNSVDGLIDDAFDSCFVDGGTFLTVDAGSFGTNYSF